MNHARVLALFGVIVIFFLVVVVIVVEIVAAGSRPLERPVPAKHGVDNDAQRPHVALRAVVAPEHFRRGGVRCAHEGGKPLGGRGEDRVAEVDDLDLRVRISPLQHDVLI